MDNAENENKETDKNENIEEVDNIQKEQNTDHDSDSEKKSPDGSEVDTPISLSVYKLHDAALSFDANRVEELIASGYDVNEKYGDGFNVVYTMLNRYIELSFVEQVHAKPKFIEILSVVARNGIDINSIDNSKQTVLHFIAAQGNYPDIIKPLLAAGMRVNTQDARSQTALHAAILRSHVNNVQALVEGGADTDIGDTKGETALHMLCKGKRKLKSVQLLIRCGANVNSRDLGRRTPLHIATKYSRKELVKELLISGAKVNSRDTSGQTPLHYAAKSDMTGAVVAELLNRKTKINMQENVTDETPLHKFITHGTIEGFKLLIQNNPPPDPNIQNVFGETALHRAASCQDIYVWKQLLKLGGDVNVPNSNGYSPLQKALRMKNSVALSLIREHGEVVSFY